jgi:hypothetical protein
MIRIHGQYTLDDFTKAQRLNLQARRKGLSGFAAILVPMAGLILVVAVMSLLARGHVDWLALVFPVALLLALGINFLVMRPRQIARLFQQQKELSSPMEIELSEDGFGLTYRYGKSLVPWADFVKWKEDQHLILLYRSDALISFLPKRFLAGADEVEYVRGLLGQAGVPDALKTGGRDRIRQAVALILVLLMVCVLTIYLVLRTTS